MKTVTKYICKIVVLLSLIVSQAYAQLGAQYTYTLGPIFQNYPNFPTYRINGSSIMACGETWMGGTNTYGMVTKIDTSGTMQWLKVYIDALVASQFELHDIYQTGSNYLICGKTIGKDGTGCGGGGCAVQGGWAAIIDGNGNIVKTKEYSPYYFAPSIMYLAKPLPAGAGGTYAFVGEQWGNSAANCTGGYQVGVNGSQGLPNGDILVVKTDANLDTTSTVRYSLDYNFLCGGVVSSDSTFDDNISDFITTSNSLVYCGTTQHYDAAYPCDHYRDEGFVMSTQLDGTVNWAKTFYFGNSCHHDYITDVIEMGAGGDYMVIGNSYSLGQQFIMRLNRTTGAVIWCYSYSGAILTYVNKISQDVNDGNYIVSGETSNGGYDMVMFKIDANGTVLPAFTKEIGRPTFSEGAVYGTGGATTLQSTNGTYFLMGTQDQGGSNDGLMMAKLHKTLFSSGCNEQTGPITATAQSVVVRTPVVRTYLGQVIPAAITINVTDYTANQTTANLCVFAPLSITTSGTNVNCKGASTGTATASVVGGSANYTFAWSSGVTNITTSTSNTITGLPNGTYTVIISESGGAAITGTVAVTQPGSNVSATASATSPNCFGSTGSVSASPSGGTSGYTYTWSNTATSQTVNGLGTGGYTVTVTDNLGCTTTTSASVTVPSAVTGTASSSIASCGNNNGSVSVNPSGGTSGYNYSWSPGGATSQTVNGLAGATYNVTITDSKGCTGTTTATVGSTPAVTASIIGHTDVSCNGGSTGTATAGQSGGTSGFSYAWSPSGSGSALSGLAAGTYTVTVTDANSCTSTASITLTQPATSVGVTVTPTQPLCSSGSATAQANPTGGTSGYTYSWSNSTTSQIATGLSTGTYTVKVTDSNGCTSTSTTSITIPQPITASITGVNATCGNNNGSASVTANGGTGGFSYTWSNGASGLTATTLFAGPYSVTVTDGNGCTQTAAGTVNNAGAATVTATGNTNAKCKGSNEGSASVTVAGGVAPYTYSWSTTASGVTSVTGLTAGTYTISVNDANGCLASSTVTITEPTAVVTTLGSSTNPTCGSSNGTAFVTGSGGTGTISYTWSNAISGATATGLAAGPYTVTATDNNGCTGTTTFTLSNAGAPVITVNSSVDAACFGTSTGTASVSSAGGTPNYTYTWSSGPSGVGVVSASNLAAGTYTVTVNDANSCSSTQTITISQPVDLSATFATTAATCGTATGIATATAAGGTAPYTYAWSSLATGATATNLAAGNYTVTITDAHSCTQTAQTSISNLGAATLTATGAQTICIGQTATITTTLSGGTSPYTYSWSGGTTTLTGPGPQSVSPISTTTYTVVVTDASGCMSNSQTVQITVNPPLTVLLNATSTSVCSGSSATLIATPSGGNGTYSYSWSPGGATGATITVNPSVPTTYTVTVSDNCNTPVTVANQPISVNPLPAITMTSDITAGCGIPLCVNFSMTSTGSCKNVAWDFGDTDTSASSTPKHCYASAGAFTVMVKCTDINGCSATDTMKNMINVYTRPKADFTYTSPVVAGAEVDFTNKSVGASNYIWNFNDASSGPDSVSILANPIHTFKDSGMFCVKLYAISAAGGCSDTAVQCIKVNEACNLPDSIPNVFSPNGDNINDLFTIKSTGLSSLICTLFNRWGMNIYKYDAVNTGWDGRTFSDNTSPAGTYYYILDATCLDGKKKDGHGFVQLMR